jgi:hypothetical protein
LVEAPLELVEAVGDGRLLVRGLDAPALRQAILRAGVADNTAADVA